MKKEFLVIGHYPEALVKFAKQQARVTASHFSQASNIALKQFQKREGIKRRKFTRVRLDIFLAGPKFDGLEDSSPS